MEYWAEKRNPTLQYFNTPSSSRSLVFAMSTAGNNAPLAAELRKISGLKVKVAEPLARLGAAVTGLDATPEVIAVARDHAAAMGLDIDYRVGDVQDLEGQFDLITCMEVVEHVANPAAFVNALARRLASGGLLVMSTPNATGWSKLMMITIG